MVTRPHSSLPPSTTFHTRRMENAPPDPKRQRISSGSEQWSNGQHGRSLPPPVFTPGPPPSSQPYNSQQPPFSRPGSGPPSHHIPGVDERRHPQEQEYAAQIHDPQRGLPVGPSNPFAAYPGLPRDPAFKREEGDPGPLQQPRSNSTGHTTESHMVPYAAEDPRRQSMSFEAMPGQPLPQPPPGYRQPYPPGPPQIQTQIPPGADPYYSPNPIYPNGNSTYQAALGQQRRKAPRTSQACVQCRTAKAKCDDPKPCTACRKAGVQCDFKPPELKQSDKVQQEMAGNIARIAAQIPRILDRLTAVEKRLPRGDRSYKREGNSCDSEPKPADGDMKGEASELSLRDTDHSALRQRDRTGFSHDQVSDEDDEEDGGMIVYPKNDPAIPENHTTPASRMLTWPSIYKWIGEFIKSDDKIRNHHYTTTREVKRGVLRLYGKGEAASENQHVLEKEPMPDQVGDVIADDGMSEASASPVADYLWGQTGSFTPPTSISSIRAPEKREGGLDSTNSSLDLSYATVRALADSYLQNMNIMHPIIGPAQLDKLLKNFIREVPGSDNSKKEIPGFVNTPATGGKRKRTDGEEDSLPSQYLKPGRPQRSIDSAFVLVILALGKVCLHKQSLPHVVPETSSDQSYASSRNGHPSPSNFSPTVSPQSMLSSPKDINNRITAGRRNSLDSNLPTNLRRSVQPPTLRNLDVIPGLAYFAAASDLIGNQLGGNTLRHVQVNILASLYHGQLARVAESHAYLHAACRALQVILLGKSERFRLLIETNRMGTTKDTPILIAFWTCLQLESDIAAELDFPQSGILRWEDQMPWPDGAAIRAMGIPPTQVNSYMAQLFTRKHLNKIHKNLYEVGKEEDYKLPIDPKTTAALLDKIGDSERLLGSISSSLRPDVGEYEDPEIVALLKERLDAKKYGALNITYRPCLMMIMNRPRDYPFNQIPSDIRQYAQLCLNAMENSTGAFPMKNGERVIITNPWGTAHAQWGNVICLQAAYMDPDLRRLIDPVKLTTLINKTLDFLIKIAKPSSSLAQDIKILEYMAVNVTKLLPAPRSNTQMLVGGSFTSNGSSEMSPS